MRRLRAERVLRFIAVATGVLISSAPAFASDQYAACKQGRPATYLARILAPPALRADPVCEAEPFVLSEPLVGEWRSSPSLPTQCWPPADSIQFSARAEETDNSLATARSDYIDMWERIRKGFAMPMTTGPRVAKYRAWYTKHPRHLTRVLERGQRYLYFIVGELERRGMPNEIALLPIIESAYNPRAQSRMRAAGLWQFIPSTGRHYGLHQDSWYDGRRDVIAATGAALDYLQFLHDTFDDWELALAAYNWGEDSVQRAIARNLAHRKPIRYRNLRMPNETRNYLPKLQAVKDIINAHQLFGVALPHVPNKPYFIAINAAADIDILKAAQFADMSVGEFQLLNAGYAGPIIIREPERQIVLPVDKVDRFHAGIEYHRGPLSSWQMYTLKKGDTLRTLARRFSISASQLREANGIVSSTQLRLGQRLLVPVAQSRSDATAQIGTQSSAGIDRNEQQTRLISEEQVQRMLPD